MTSANEECQKINMAVMTTWQLSNYFFGLTKALTRFLVRIYSKPRQNRHLSKPLSITLFLTVLICQICFMKSACHDRDLIQVISAFLQIHSYCLTVLLMSCIPGYSAFQDRPLQVDKNCIPSWLTLNFKNKVNALEAISGLWPFSAPTQLQQPALASQKEGLDNTFFGLDYSLITLLHGWFR